MRGFFVALLFTLGAAGAMAAAAATAPSAAAGITIAGGASPVTLGATDLAKLPAVTVAISFKTSHGQVQASFAGPLLWTVLGTAHATTKKPNIAAREIVTVTGSDKYSAVLAMGEIMPALEAKQVVLATTMNGKPLVAPRLVVPGDHFGARAVHDVVRVAVSSPTTAPPRPQ